MRHRLIFQRFQDERGARRVHSLDSLDLVSDQTPELFGVRNADPDNVTIFARDAMEFFDFGNSREQVRGPGFATASLYENESYKCIVHDSPPKQHSRRGITRRTGTADSIAASH